MLLIMVLAKYRNRLDMSKTGRPCDLCWPACNLLWKSLQTNIRRKVLICWNQAR